MKIYFYIVDVDNNSREINSYLKKAGLFVISNLASSVEQKNASQFQSLDKIDMLLVYGNKLDQQSGYFLAATLSQNKKVLCLLPQGVKVDDSLKNLQDDSILGKNLSILFFQGQGWQTILADYFKDLDKRDTKEMFNIKYTLRISNKISDYLNWQYKQTGIKKADWLRDKIQEFIKEDQTYQDYIKNRFSK